MFRALVLDRQEDGSVTHAFRELDDSQLPEEGEVTVRISHTTLNYKDGMCLNGLGGLVRNYPHVPGVDFAGEVETSDDSRYAPGDQVALNGQRVGEVWWGGYAEKARVKADWLVPIPEGLDARLAMAVGTAGFTSVLATMTLEEHGLTPEGGPVLITGAAGGVGSVAVAMLAHLGYEVTAVTGRPEAAAYLRELGAAATLAREELSQPSKRPLESETWAGCIDSVGGVTLARVLAQMKHSASVASVGLAGGSVLQTTVIPFLLRGVNILGIDSVTLPYDRRLEAWNRAASDIPQAALERMIVPARLEDLPDLGKNILEGGIRGRVVVELES